MPKTAKNLWHKIVEWDNLLLASKEASRHKRYYVDIMRFNANLEENLFEIRDKLVKGEWLPGQYREFQVYEPKLRVIHAPAFCDRVVHHALVQIIGQFFERRFIDQSFACRVGKGTHAASSYLCTMLNSAKNAYARTYVLKADISKYFNSIDHEILLGIIERIIGDKNVLDLIRKLVTCCNCTPGAKGLPLGALTSQLFANSYLDQLDHYVKDGMKMRHYARYMDDFIILHGNKQELWDIYFQIRDFLNTRLRLELNRKTKVFPASQGIDFVGYRHWIDHILPRKRNTARAKKQFRKLTRDYADWKIDLEYVRPRVASFCGMMKHCDGYRTAESVLSELVLQRKTRE